MTSASRNELTPGLPALAKRCRLQATIWYGLFAGRRRTGGQQDLCRMREIPRDAGDQEEACRCRRDRGAAGAAEFGAFVNEVVRWSAEVRLPASANSETHVTSWLICRHDRLGLMGSTLSARLIDAGIEGDRLRRRCGKTDGLKASGAEFATFATDVAARCRIVVIAVYDAAQAIGLLPDLANATSPPLVNTPPPARRADYAIADFAASTRLALIGAPISAPAPKCAPAPPPRWSPAIGHHRSCRGGARHPARSGSMSARSYTSRKLASNLILQNNRAALAEALAFAESLGLDAPASFATARQSAHSRGGQQGTEDAGAGFLAAIAYRADLEGRRADPAGGRPARPALAADLSASRAAAQGDCARGRTATAPPSSGGPCRTAPG